MDVRDLKIELAGLAKDTVAALRDILTKDGTSANAKLKAIELVYDRIGLPALKASIHKQINESPYISREDAEEARKRIAEERKEIEAELDELNSLLQKEGSNGSE